MRRKREERLSLLLIVLVLAFFIPSYPAGGESGSIALVNGILIDGTGDEPVPDSMVVIQGGHIVDAGRRKDIQIPAGARVIDVRGGTILPGFINAHVHSRLNEDNLRKWAWSGVTTVRDIGSQPDFSLRDELVLNNAYARLVMSGPMITVPDGYPIVPWGGASNALPVDSPEDARQKVGALLDEGADIIKIALESGDTLPRRVPNTLSLEEASAIVEVAHNHGTIVSAHVTASRDLDRAIAAGVDDIAHMVVDTLPADLVERIAADDVFWVPTLELWKCVGHGYREAAIENLGRFIEAGGRGRVALGTDFNGYNCSWQLGMPITEMELMQEAGMTPMEIIVAATRNGAYVCNMEKELGTIKSGKVADVIVVEGDPLEDIHNLERAVIVIHNGAIIRNEMKSSAGFPWYGVVVSIVFLFFLRGHRFK